MDLFQLVIVPAVLFAVFLGVLTALAGVGLRRWLTVQRARRQAADITAARHQAMCDLVTGQGDVIAAVITELESHRAAYETFPQDVRDALYAAHAWQLGGKLSVKLTMPVPVALAGLAAAALLAAGCSSIQPSLGQYAIVTGHGNLSNQQVKNVVDPGQQIHTGSGTTTWYVPANVRNYVTAPTGGDRSNPQQELTGSSSSSPGMADYTWTYVTWELNPNHGVLAEFLPFCLKYACASTQPQNDSSNAGLSHSSVTGWNNMLAEFMGRAIDNATRQVITGYGPDLWTDRAQWDTYQDKIAAALPGQIAQLTGSSIRYFCGPGSTPASCKPFTVTVSSVTPVDQSVVTAYNQEVAAAYAQQADKSRLSAAQGVYGADANWVLGMEDLIHTCGAERVPCYIYSGQPPIHP